MNLWKEFLNRSKRDLEVSEICFKKKDYELASYLLQQALEKSIKSYMLKNNAIGNPKQLHHLTLGGIFHIIIEKLREGRRKHQNNIGLMGLFDCMIKLCKKYQEVFKPQEINDTKKKLPFWKVSLQLSLSNEDKKYLQETFIVNFQQDIEKCNDIFKKISEDFTNLPKGFTNRIEESKIMEALNESREDYGDKISQIPSLKILEPLLLFMDTKLVNIIIKTFAHEDIGRYPTEVDGKISTELYAKNPTLIKNMIEDVRTVCSDLEKRMEE